jgi:tripartite-type tricarboxylate transporter receptor subunit TctC
MRAGFLAIVGLYLAAAMPAVAQDYPNRPIRVVVPFPAGGPNDVIARVVGKAVSESTGQPVVIDNRAGAGGVVGTDFVAKSPPDGYTLTVTSAGALVINRAPQAMPYDTFKDLTLITQVVAVPELLVVHPSVPARTLAELVALAKSQPGKLNFASTGNGGMPHLAAEMLKFSAGIDIVHIPYRGAAPAVTDMVGGQVQLMFADVPVLLPHVQAGKLRALAVGSAARAPALPDLPTTAEAGFPQVRADNWYGLVGPAGIPAPVAAKILAEFRKAMAQREVIESMRSQGATLVGSSPEEFTTFLRAEEAKWAQVVKVSGAKLD